MSNERLQLRAVEPSDAAVIWDIEDDNTQWIVNGMMAPISMHMITEYALNYDADPYRTGQLRLVARFAVDGTDEPEVVVGLADLYDISARNHTAFVGIYVRSEYRGRGYGAEMLRQLEKYARNILNIRTVVAKVAAVNSSSGRLFVKAGYEKAGEIKQWICLPEGSSDLTLYQKCLNI